MRAYPRYRDSGVEWLGEVPEHWGLRQLGLIGSLFKGSGGTKDDEVEDGVPCVRYGDIYTQHRYFIRETRADITEESAAKYTPIRYGDILFAGSGETIEEIGKSAANLIEGPAYCGGDVIVFRPSIEADATFMGYAADCSTSIYQKACMGRGVTVMHIYGQELRHLLLPLPPLDEQRAIAAFLDRETERIDALVAKKRLLIERLEEYRSALITRTVTRGLPPEAARAAGLDPSPRLKPSGVEWLGEVPEHWEVKRLKQVAHVRYGLAEPPPEDPEGIPILRATNVKSGKISTEGLLHVGAEDVPNGRNAFLKAGEILVVRSGAYTGDSSIVPPEYEGSVAGYDIVVRVLNGFPGYVAWQLLGPTVLKAQFHLRSMRAAQQHLNAEDIGETWITCPPLREQRVLSSYLDRAAGQIDAVMAQTSEAIERLREYRTALITAAVTGKIDVRETATAAAGLGGSPP